MIKQVKKVNLIDILIKLKNESGQEIWALNKLLSAMPEIKAYLANTVAVPYTAHNWSHAKSVEELCAKLVDKRLLYSLSETELFILIISIWLHDAGMVPKNVQQSYDDTRASHYRRIHDIIKADELVFLNDLDSTLRGHIADICFNHGQDSPAPLKSRVLYKGQPIRKQLIASLLRLSDICDISNERIPLSIYRTYNFPETSRPFWETHLAIHGVEPITEDDKTIIILEAEYTGARQKYLIDKAVEYLEHEIKILNPFFAQNGWVLSEQVKRNIYEKIPLGGTKLKTVSEGIYKLLCEYMYESKDVFVRELIQNSIDSHKQKKAEHKIYQDIISITVYGNKSDGEFVPRVLRIYDNGIGMDQDDVQEYLLKIGNAISKSPEVIQRLKLGSEVEELISEFGIGFLTVFPVSERVEIFTRKEGFYGLSVNITKPFLADQHNPEHPVSIDRCEKLENQFVADGIESFGGTIVVIHLNESGAKIKIDEAISKYCRNTTIPVCYSQKLITNKTDYLESHEHTTQEGSQPTCRLLESQFFGNKALEPMRVVVQDDGPIIKGVFGYITGKTDNDFIVCQEGIFVENCPDLVIEGLKGIIGEINLKAKSVVLLAARNKIKRDEKFGELKALLEDHFLDLVGKVVRAHSLGDKEEESNIFGFLNWVCKNKARDRVFLQRVFDKVENGIIVMCGEDEQYKPLSYVRKQIEENNISEVVRQVIQVYYYSHICVSKIDGYEVAVVPRLHPIRYGYAKGKNRIVITVLSAHQPASLARSHIESRYLTGEFYRTYFEMLGIRYNEFEVDEFEDMVSEEAIRRGDERNTIKKLLRETKLAPFADEAVNAKCLIRTGTRYINLENQKVQRIISEYTKRMESGSLKKGEEVLIKSYLQIISLRVREAIESIESIFEQAWFQKSEE